MQLPEGGNYRWVLAWNSEVMIHGHWIGYRNAASKAIFLLTMELMIIIFICESKSLLNNYPILLTNVHAGGGGVAYRHTE